MTRWTWTHTDADLDDLGTDDLETDEFGASDAEAGGDRT